MSADDRFQIRVEEVQLFERDVVFRMPFRFGVVTLEAAPQAFARVRIRTAAGKDAWGAAAETMAPKWFDKNVELTNEENFEQLRQALRTARTLYLEQRDLAAPFTLHARTHDEQVRRCAEAGLNALIAQYGPALIDRAVIDAACRGTGLSFYAAMQANLCAIAPDELAPDLAGFDADAFLAGLAPADHIHARHTVGLVDPLTAADIAPGKRVGDGLPETLEEVIDTYGHRYFKLKVGGDLAADLERLATIAAVIDARCGSYSVTLDGNEQYRDLEGICELWEAIAEHPRLARLHRSVLFIEQPIVRSQALERDVRALAARRPVIIDESDSAYDVFVRAKTLGYAGISSKTCKGVYRSLLNAMRCAAWTGGAEAQSYFMSGEDLTTQAGLSVQQDLALVALLGLGHVERNGHHYVHGMTGVPQAEQDDFLQHHGDLYREHNGVTCLRIEDGQLAIASLGREGFASVALPRWDDMRPIS
jgi:hypothetical protein